MNTDDGPEADALASILAVCDEALAEGLLPPLARGSAGTPEQARLLKNLDCLRLLRGAWPRHVPAPGGGAAPDRLGPFRITRELGRGGFGIVYLAFDPRLARPVALKVPRADIVSAPHLRERFHHEARAAAALDHPNVVTVYETGEADGVAYIASAYCPGPTLAQWLEGNKSPVPFGEAAELVARLADGLAHAHDRGILHRDLKPANILLEAEGAGPSPGPARLRPKVTDFGLAKRLFADDRAALTADGAVLGTPNYLAPEQVDPALGGCGPAVDVYGLGAILYELLTHRPPFVSDSVMETLRQVGGADPLPPRRLRPQVPRDLETICLKCLEKSPRHRYPGAGALADDLRRFVRGEPVRARPVGPGGRARRWARRRPAVAALIGLLAAAVLVGLGGVFLQWRRAEHFADRMRDERNAAVAERERAEATFRKARELVDRLSRVGEALAHRPGLQGTRREVVEDVLAFHEDFLNDRSEEPAFRLDAARAGVRVGTLRLELGQYDRAEAAFRRAAGWLDALAAERPGDAPVRFSRGQCAHFFGHLLRATGRHPGAATEYRRAAALFDALAAEHPDHAGYRVALAGSLSNAAAADLACGRTDRADADLARACRLQRAALAAAPRDAHRRAELAICLETLAIRHALTGRPPEALADARAALELFRGLVAEFPPNTDYRGYLARTLATTGGFVREAGDAAEADRLTREGVEVARRLAADTSGVPAHQLALARALIGLADALPAGATAEAERLTQEAAGTLRAAVRSPGGGGAENNELAWLIATAPGMGTPADARACADRAVTAEPGNASYWNTLAAARYRSGDWKGTVAALDRAAEHRTEYSPIDGALYALAFCRLGQSDRAREALAKASARFRVRPPSGGARRLYDEAVAAVAAEQKD